MQGLQLIFLTVGANEVSPAALGSVTQLQTGHLLVMPEEGLALP